MMKNFDELTIIDDYMFCTVMEDTQLCKELLAMVLKNKIGKIVKLSMQKPLKTQIASKGVRLDIILEDEHGTRYDVEMQTTDQRNLPKRMRYYQCAIDNSAINKGGDYNDLPNTFIIFLCTFDFLQRNMPIYTVSPSCRETGEIFNDGTIKVIVNSQAAEKAEDELRSFLSYMNGAAPETAFTKKIDKRVNETKRDEEKRREYMLLKSFEMDARRAGIQQGFADGSYQKARETAKILKQLHCDMSMIIKSTGLSKEEIERL